MTSQIKLKYFIMYKVVYDVLGVELVAKFDSLGSLCCFLVACRPLSFVVYDFDRRVIASTRSMKCSVDFLSHYETWCTILDISLPFDFRLK